MSFRYLPLILLALLIFNARASGQRATPPSTLADDLCSCVGTIDPASSDQLFDLSIRHCLNRSMTRHSGEVIEIMRRFPGKDGKFFLLGLLLGGALDRTCPQYPAVKERLRTLIEPAPDSAASNT